MKQLNYSRTEYNKNTHQVNGRLETGGTFYKIFEIHNKKFISVTCVRFINTDSHKTKTSSLSNVLNFIKN